MTKDTVPTRKTRFAAAFRSGRRECWEAESLDGRFTFVREDSPGTPWLVYDGDTFLFSSPSLPKAAASLARDLAQAQS